jgi:biotin operon repressor
MQENNPNYYAIIPANVRYCKKLKANAKLLYGEISALCNAKGYCWATNEYFAELYGMSSTTISRLINQLKEEGFVKIEYEKRGFEVVQRTIWLTDGCQNSQPTVDQNDKENNTLNNTINILPSAKKATGKSVPVEFNECRKHFYKLYITNLHRKPKWGAVEAKLLKADLKKFEGIPGLTQSPGTILKLAMEVWIYNEADNQWLVDRAVKSGYIYTAFHTHLDAILEYMRRVAEEKT